jgi:hypothetical protein
MLEVNFLYGDLPVPRAKLEADATAQCRLYEGGGGELRRRQHHHVSQHTADGAGEGGVEETHDDPGPGSQFLQLECDVQVDKVCVAEQAAYGGLPHARFPERVYTLGVADDQWHLGSLGGPGKRRLRPRADRGHRNSKLTQLLKHAHPQARHPPTGRRDHQGSGLPARPSSHDLVHAFREDPALYPAVAARAVVPIPHIGSDLHTIPGIA